MLRLLHLFNTIIILWLVCLGCQVDSPLGPGEGEGGSGVDPDTIVSDTAAAINPDSLLAASTRFGDQDVFTESALQSRVDTFRRANDYLGRPASLTCTFIAPANDTMQFRPFVLMVHEGAFLFGDKANEEGKARLLARKGFAAAAINYRLGFNGGSERNPCGGNNLEVVQALYRAVQDTYAALHYFASRSDELGIDPGQMVLAGSSAGAITIAALMYMKEADFEGLQPGIVRTLGHLDPDRDGAPFRVRALLTQLGFSILKSSYITGRNVKPMIFFQRTGDNVLPYEKGNLFYCPSYLPSEGAAPTVRQLKSLSAPFELNYQPEAGHQLSYTETYITSRYALFMKRLWSGDDRQTTIENFTVQEDIRLD